MIDKDSVSWKTQPYWVKFSLLGVSKRRPLVLAELIALGVGLVTWVVKPDIFATPALFLLAYLISKLIAKTDQQKLW